MTFIAVYETMNYNRAAEILGVSRQAVSQNLRELGNQLGGLKLFLHDPVNRCVTPTSEATAMYPDIKEAVEKMIEVEEGLQAFTSESKAVIRMGIPSSVASVLLADFFKEFRQKYPKVRFEFHSRNSEDLLAQKKIDLIINDRLLHNCKFVELFEIDNIFIASKEFMDDNSIGVNITKEKLIMLPIIGHTQALNEFKNKNGLDLVSFLETTSSEPIFALTKNGVGVGYYYDKVLTKQNVGDDVVRINIADCVPIKTKIVCCYNKSHITKAASTFIETLRKFCSTL